ncbi:hypothetical protein [Actinobacillus capsulatus]|uniref:hypothetical protein n=1 Tax=Actinobacillus capsulatus TaxID=717 RepID=UPI000382AD83|nr:hypothetical protein [Actinobacillus capsulatus]
MNKTISLLLSAISGFSYANSYQYNNNPYFNNQYGNIEKHYDPHYMYNYRTGIAGNYTYNYDVEDIDGSGAYGDCDMTGKYGYCIIVNEYGDVVQAEAEWIDYGVMIVIDEYGNEYEMEAQ